MSERAEIVSEVAAAVGLAEGEAGVHSVVRTVARFEPVAVRKVSRATELPVPIVSAICGELRKRGVVSTRRPVRLTRLGRALFDTARSTRRSGACWRWPTRARSTASGSCCSGTTT
jgi:predicted methyltransferase